MGRKVKGSVRRNKGAWEASVKHDYLGRFDTEAEAQDVVRAYVELLAGEARKPTTLHSYGIKWFERREFAGCVRGLRQEKSVWRAHVQGSSIADVPLKTLRAKHVDAWVKSLLKKPATLTKRTRSGTEYIKSARTLARQTVVHARRLVKECLGDAVLQGKLKENPAAAVKVPRVPKVVEAEDEWTYLTEEEISAVMALDLPVDRSAAFAVAIYSGLRKGELFGLRWKDITLHGKEPCINVRRSWNGDVKEPASRRCVPLLEPARLALEKWRKVQNPAPAKGLVFPSPSGSLRSTSYAAGWFDTHGNGKRYPGVRARAGVRGHVRFHDLRHTCASHLVMGTWGRAWTLEEVKAFLGHSSITVSQRYAHLSPKSIHSAARETVPREFVGK